MACVRFFNMIFIKLLSLQTLCLVYSIFKEHHLHLETFSCYAYLLSMWSEMMIPSLKFVM